MSQTEVSSTASPDHAVIKEIESTRAEISEDERHQREALGQLFSINKKIKEISRRQNQINEKMLNFEGDVRQLAQDVQTLERQKTEQTELLSKRLRQLYQSRGLEGFQWFFSARTPMEMERNHRFLMRMIESDHRRLEAFLGNLKQLRNKRAHLKTAVVKLAHLKRQGLDQESRLSESLREKSNFITEIKRSRDIKVSTLKDLRTKTREFDDLASYAFFERKGLLHPPVETRLTREYGTYVDPQFRFRLAHKGLFYSGSRHEVRAVHRGRVAFAGELPGYGRAVILDHGENYHSVYGFVSRVHVRVGAEVKEGDLVGTSGEVSPLFGPGLYFEIRHFTDAIDPRPWFKESWIKTADIRQGENL